jgi:tRNA U34 5-carboxymethylaminomethyl modifying GTPase MnmE/TrmE
MEALIEFTEQRLEAILRSASLLLVSMRLTQNRKKVDDLVEGLRDDFALMVLGEFSSGKSSFVNIHFARDVGHHCGEVRA